MTKTKKVSVKGTARVMRRQNDAVAATRLAAKTVAVVDAATLDGYQNFSLSLGLGTDNSLSASQYGFNPITRMRVQLEWIHRGSWLGGVAIDLVADDMTRAGVEMKGQLQPTDIEAVEECIDDFGVWNSLNDTVKWSRLYGGAIAVIMIDGQKLNTPFRLETVAKDQFKGLVVLDRWMVDPSLNDLVTDPGTSLGLPKFYTVFDGGVALSGERIHHSRCIRLEGIRLPFYQRVQENLWGLSVIERLFDRLVSFDAATEGASQLIHKSFLRTLKLDGLRDALAAGGKAERNVVKQVTMMRRNQQNEGVTIIDAKDEFKIDQASGYSGIAELILRFGEQISGSLQIPLVRLFGQSPAGMNSSGDSDLRTYYDGIKQQQVRHLKRGVTLVYRVAARSRGVVLPKGFAVDFRSLWQLTEKERADVAVATAQAVDTALAANVIDVPTAAKELRQSADVTGIFSNITEEKIAEMTEREAIEAPPDPKAAAEAAGEGRRAAEGAETAEGASTGAIAPPGRLLGAMGKPLVEDYMPFSLAGGLDVVIENPPGSIRRGAGGDGTYWEVVMPAAYGYIRGTSSSEGPDEQCDCFVGDRSESKTAWVVHQKRLDTDVFDELKVLLNFGSAKDALDAYCRSYSDGRGRDRIMKVDERAVDGLLEWLRAEHGYRPGASIAA